MNRRSWRGVMFAVVAVLTVAGCTTPEERARRIDTGGRVVTVTNGSAPSLEMRRDQELQVRLANTGTTGRAWSLVEMAPGVLVQDGPSVFEREKLVSNISEAAGDEVFRFKPVMPGTTTLKFDFRRPRNLEPATQTASFTVSVK